MYKSQPFRDYVDGHMALEHAYVHQALMEGSAKIFAAWEKHAAEVGPSRPRRSGD